jgi:hypothetical protein
MKGERGRDREREARESMTRIKIRNKKGTDRKDK